jgi:serine/threonine protein kinase
MAAPTSTSPTTAAASTMTTSTPPPQPLPPTAAEFDVTLLRRVLRLVHCLQKERGSSCAYYSSRSSSSSSPSNSTDATNATNASLCEKRLLICAVGPARRDTDHALSLSMLCGKSKGDLPIQKTLVKIRNMLRWNENPVDDNQEEDCPRTGLHRFLVCFNTLVSSVIHEYILRQTNLYACASNNSKSKSGSRRTLLWNQQAPSAEDAAASRSNGAPLDPLQHGADIQMQNMNMNPLTSSIKTGTGGMKRIQSHQDFQLGTPKSLSMPRIHSDVDLVLSFNNSMHGAALIHSNSNSSMHGHGALQVLTSTAAADGPESQQDSGGAVAPAVPPSQQQVSFNVDEKPAEPEESDSARTVRLLHLLNIFVQLKESTGVERATVSSILADDVDSVLLLNDLVLEVENQRRRVEELDTLHVGPLRNLVQELVVLTPEMLQLQRRLLSGTDLEHALQDCSYDVDKLWDLLTVYIDKLHSLELLIVEEIECCAPAAASVTVNVNDSVSVKSQSSLLADAVTAPLAVVLGGGVVGVDGASDTAIVLQRETSITMGILKHLFGPTDQDKEALLQQVEAMSPADLKEKLLMALARGSNNNNNDENNNNVASSDSSSCGSGNGEPKGVEDLLKELSCAPASKEWEIDLYEIRFQKRIGQGSAGTTYLANWSGQQVAVKVASITEMGLEGWRTEVQALQKLHHPNIIRLLGSVYHPSPLTICLVLEYCKAGDLSNAIHKLTPRNFFFHVSTSIANGMNYLHNRGIIHRDIKPANVLLDGDVASGLYSVKVTDFGVATESSVGASDRTAETGTYRWMAPEVIRHEAYSNLADVYSFAVLMWQLLTREDPFSPKSQIDAAMCVARDGVRPPFPEGTPVAVRELIEACWNDDPALRLPFDQISTKLKHIESKLTDEERQWIEAPLGHSVYKKPKTATRTPQLNVDHLKQPIPQNVGKQEKRGSKAKEKEEGGKQERRGSGFLGRLGIKHSA